MKKSIILVMFSFLLFSPLISATDINFTMFDFETSGLFDDYAGETDGLNNNFATNSTHYKEGSYSGGDTVDISKGGFDFALWYENDEYQFNLTNFQNAIGHIYMYVTNTSRVSTDQDGLKILFSNSTSDGYRWNISIQNLTDNGWHMLNWTMNSSYDVINDGIDWNNVTQVGIQLNHNTAGDFNVLFDYMWIQNTDTYVRVNTHRFNDSVKIQEFQFNISNSTWSAYNSTTDGELYLYFNSLEGNYTFTINSSGFNGNIQTIQLSNEAYFHNVSLYPNSTLNLTFYDEETGDKINHVYLEVISDNYSGNYSTATGNISLDLRYPSTYTFRYINDSYLERFYYIDLDSHQQTNLPLYLVRSSPASNVTAIVYDETNNLVEGAYIEVQRYDITTNSYKSVEVQKTNFEGRCTLHLVLNDEFYKFLVEYPFGTLKKESVPDYVYDTTLNFQITLGEEIAENFYYSQNVTYSLLFNNATDNFRFVFSDENNLMSQGCLKVYYLSTATGSTLLNSTCVAAASGTILSHVTNTSGYCYSAKSYAYFGDTEYFLDSITHCFVTDSSFDSLGVMLIVLLTILFALSAAWSKTLALIITPVPLLIGSIINIVEIATPLCMGLEVIFCTIAYWVSRNA